MLLLLWPLAILMTVLAVFMILIDPWWI